MKGSRIEGMEKDKKDRREEDKEGVKGDKGEEDKEGREGRRGTEQVWLGRDRKADADLPFSNLELLLPSARAAGIYFVRRPEGAEEGEDEGGEAGEDAEGEAGEDEGGEAGEDAGGEAGEDEGGKAGEDAGGEAGEDAEQHEEEDRERKEEREDDEAWSQLRHEAVALSDHTFQQHKRHKGSWSFSSPHSHRPISHSPRRRLIMSWQKDDVLSEGDVAPPSRRRQLIMSWLKDAWVRSVAFRLNGDPREDRFLVGSQEDQGYQWQWTDGTVGSSWRSPFVHNLSLDMDSGGPGLPVAVDGRHCGEQLEKPLRAKPFFGYGYLQDGRFLVGSQADQGYQWQWTDGVVGSSWRSPFVRNLSTDMDALASCAKVLPPEVFDQPTGVLTPTPALASCAKVLPPEVFDEPTGVLTPTPVTGEHLATLSSPLFDPQPLPAYANEGLGGDEEGEVEERSSVGREEGRWGGGGGARRRLVGRKVGLEEVGTPHSGLPGGLEGKEKGKTGGGMLAEQERGNSEAAAEGGDEEKAPHTSAPSTVRQLEEYGAEGSFPEQGGGDAGSSAGSDSAYSEDGGVSEKVGGARVKKGTGLRLQFDVAIQIRTATNLVEHPSCYEADSDCQHELYELPQMTFESTQKSQALRASTPFLTHPPHLPSIPPSSPHTCSSS
ncbi:unnamed protein product [Closterium sp. Naga37s-1]|nr:unnamed protein product [Closterium sp. Naga37s-1]